MCQWHCACFTGALLELGLPRAASLVILPGCQELRPPRQVVHVRVWFFSPCTGSVVIIGREKRLLEQLSWAHGQARPGPLLLTWCKRLLKRLANVCHTEETRFVFLLETVLWSTVVHKGWWGQAPGSCIFCWRHGTIHLENESKKNWWAWITA